MTSEQIADQIVRESDGHLDCWHCRGGAVLCAGCADLKRAIIAAIEQARKGSDVDTDVRFKR